MTPEPTLLQVLVDGQVRMQEDITQIKLTLAERKGERRVALWSVSAVGAFVSLVVTATVEFFKSK